LITSRETEGLKKAGSSGSGNLKRGVWLGLILVFGMLLVSCRMEPGYN